MEIENYLSNEDINTIIMALGNSSRYSNSNEELQKYNDVLNKVIRIPKF